MYCRNVQCGGPKVGNFVYFRVSFDSKACAWYGKALPIGSIAKLNLVVRSHLAKTYLLKKMINLLLLIFATSLGAYLFLKWATKNHDIFKKQGIKNEKPFPLIGNSTHIFTGDFLEGIQRTYSMFPNEKVVGHFNLLQPIYFVRSPEVIKQLTVKDFSFFQDHASIISEKSEDFIKHVLFAMKGKQWRDMRSSLSPMFTGRKMRVMLDLITKCSQQMCEYLKEEHEKFGSTAQPMKILFSKYTNDVIATCAFGVEVNSLKYPNNDIYKIGQTIMGVFSGTISFMQIAKFLIVQYFPKIAKLLGLAFFPDDIKIKFTKLITHTMEVRKRENIQRQDMLQLLMKLKEGQLPKEKEMDEIDPENKMINGEFKTNWSDNELFAQCFQFFLGGFHTMSTALSFCSYALAVNPDLQEKLIIEIDETHESSGGAPMTYEIIQKMKYMDMFISEVLRMWPPLINSDRQCNRSYTYEDNDGLKFTVQKGDVIFVPIYALHMDPKYFPNPQKFDPERFNEENRPNINIYTYLPFGVGPRNCIAFRFAWMQMKAVIFQLLLNFRLSVCEETEVPVQVITTPFNLLPKGEIHLQVIPREDKMRL